MIVTVFAPAAHVAASPLTTGVTPLRIVTVAASSAGVAVIILVASVVAASYSSTVAENNGVRTNDPIASPNKVDSKGLF